MKQLILFLLFAGVVFIPQGFSAEEGASPDETQDSQNSAIVEEQDFDSDTTEPAVKNTETFKVTGSRIRRIDFEGPSPLTVYTKEDLDNSGYLSLSEFLTNTSLSNFGSTLIHSRSTLTLVNGTRLVRDRAENFIPTSAIERVEILKDGSSALYGSDVVGGVINIITKQDFESPEISLKLSPALYPLYKGGSEADASVVFGKKFNKGHFISTLQYQYSGDFKMLDRKEWYDDYFWNDSPFPSFEVGQNIIVDENCPEDLKVKKDAAVVACKHNYIPYAYISPKSHSLSSYNYAEHELFNEVSLYTQWFGFFSKATEEDWPIIDELEIPAGHKMSAGSGSAGTLKYLFNDISYQDESTSTLYLDGLMGARGYLSKTWDFDWNLKWSNTWSKRILSNHPYIKDLKEAIVSGAYDPFNPEVRDSSKVKLYDAIYKNNDTRLFSSLDFSGETGFWDIDMALGAQAYVNRYRNNADPKVIKGEIFGLEAAETKDLPFRTLGAVYAEGVKNFSNLLEVQLAGRIDRYSDFGWTANPMLAAYFKPSSGFLVRSSVGTSFEAPALSSLYKPETKEFIVIWDTVACYNELKENKHFDPIYSSLTGEEFQSQEAKDKLIKEFLVEQSSVVENEDLPETVQTAFKGLTGKLGDQDYCRINYVKGIGKGNKNLKETKALTASLGFHWELNENHSLTADYWYNSLNGFPVPSLSGNKKTMDAELLHGKAYVEERGVQYERDSDRPYNPIKAGTPVSSLINVGGKKLYGVDIKWASDFSNWTFANGNFYFKDEFAYVLKAGVEIFPGMGYVNNLGKGEFGLPKWRNFATFGWKSLKHNLSLYLKSVARVTKHYSEFETLPNGAYCGSFLSIQYGFENRCQAGLV